MTRSGGREDWTGTKEGQGLPRLWLPTDLKVHAGPLVGAEVKVLALY